MTGGADVTGGAEGTGGAPRRVLTDLDEMLRTLDVTVRPGSYVVASVPAGAPAITAAAAVVGEDEGVTVVLPAADAERFGLAGGPPFAWLTLTVYSSLEAVGLTAAFSTALGRAGISCNVLAAFHHDHVLVPAADRDAAVGVLRSLREA